MENDVYIRSFKSTTTVYKVNYIRYEEGVYLYPPKIAISIGIGNNTTVSLPQHIIEDLSSILTLVKQKQKDQDNAE